MQDLIGTGVALITPFTATGEVDHSALEQVVNFQIDNGIDYLVVLGTTGESATLTTDEKNAVKSTITKANAGRLPMVLGIGGSNTAAVVDEINNTDLSDYVAILSVSPAYNKPTQEGIYQHFKAVATATDKPIILYNVPGRTASNMAVETVVRLAHDFENIVGIKEAAGDIVQAMKLIQYTPKDFLVISGDDMITLPMVLAGGAGVISVIGQGLPQGFSDMVRYGLNGDVEEAYELHYKIASSIDLIFEQGNPGGIKALMAHLGLIKENLRLPLVPVNNDLKSRIEAFMNQYVA
ncbi:4-hydroxy-tetrahydrodipicolinate synthase [Nonlabens arenilitoris]|uniref:4-hydroxy-tetrahydrodipicolinate synthase n=1 Tax=Nonlabens arenilitoris TaxID=1217969 RepID=A0A2S7U7G6_9FLAO|nr:4-hydroxy-tetrahydrodipicolinate synthase [Nonlabens arenilitoris]PQJ30500.1 4-hydroxy-tetrahydrodipicolinate synthase [Nonlabens arenilitoris]